MSAEAIRQLYRQLEQLGLLDHAEPGWIECATTRCAEDGICYHEAPGRSLAGDAERLAEGGVCRFVSEVEPYLRELGMPALDCTEVFNADPPEVYNYTVTVNGRPFRILDERDLGPNPIWAAAAHRAVRLVDQLLREAEAPEQLYALDEEDLVGSAHAIFLTPELARAINESPLVPESQKVHPLVQVPEWLIEFEDETGEEEQ